MNFQIITAKKTDLGDNFFVRRAIPTANCRAIGPFVFWDHMGPAQLKSGFELVVRQHPHICLATLTWLFSGKILHRDSLKNTCEIIPGEVNWMTAGSGIVHSERSQPSPEQSPANVLEGIQLWMGLPKDKEHCSPSFQHLSSDLIPKLAPQPHYTAQLIAGEAYGLKSPVEVLSPLFYAEFRMTQEGEIPLPEEPEWELGIYVVKGQAWCNNSEQQERAQEGELMVWKDRQKGDHPIIKAEPNTHLLAFGGKPFPEPRHMWWNFVSSERSAIEDAKTRWKNSEFPDVPDETDRIPLPED